MGNLTRGNLLATIKSLKKHKRPKTVVANAAVQAICGGSVPKPDKSADLKSVVERRKAILSNIRGSTVNVGCSYMSESERREFFAEFDAFLQECNDANSASSTSNL